MRLPGTARVGIFALSVGILVFASVYYWVNTRTLIPLDVPVSLAPGHIRTGDFKVNVEAYFSAQIRFPYGSGSECRYADSLRTRQLTSIGAQTISVPGEKAGTNGGITQGTYLGSFTGKPGRYNLDIEVLSATQEFDHCQPRLLIEASPYDFNEWDSILSDCILFCVFCELLGVSMLFVFAGMHFRKLSFDQLRLRIFNTDAPISDPVPTADVRPGRSIPLLVTFGIFASVGGVVVFEYDDLDAKLQLVSLLSVGVGLAFLFASRFAQMRQSSRLLPLAKSLPEHSPTWGVTGLRYRRSPTRRGWAVNPIVNIPTIALICSLTWFVWLIPVWFVYASGQRTSHGLLVSLPRKGSPTVGTASGLSAPLITVDAKHHIYLNYKQTTWEELPAVLDQALRGLTVRVVYFDGDPGLMFMDGARVFDIIQGSGARAIMVTPGSKAENLRVPN